MWLSGDPIPGSAEAVGRLREAGERVVFLTNNSSPKVGDVLHELAEAGVAAEEHDLATSSQAAALLMREGETALVCADEGVREALEKRGVHTITEGDADAVVVGFHRSFDFERLTAAFKAVHGGARLIGTNDDVTYPTPDGPLPGGGSLLAAVAAATGVEPEVAGKPHDAMAQLLRERVEGTVEGGVLVGDRPSTDGLMARRLDMRFALVFSGVTSEDDLPVEPAPDITAPDLKSIVGPNGEVAEA